MSLKLIQFLDFSPPNTCGDQESMTNMSRIVNTEPDGKNNVDAGDNVDGDVPKVKEANYVNNSYSDDEKNEKADWKVGEKQEGNDEDAD